MFSLFLLLVFSCAQANKLMAQSPTKHAKSAHNMTISDDHKVRCDKSGLWCSLPPQYPAKAILRAVRKQGHAVNILFPVTDALEYDEQDKESGQDYGKEEEMFQNMCSQRADTIRPRSAKNKEGQLKWIVNQGKGEKKLVQVRLLIKLLFHLLLLQVMRVSLCESDEEECAEGILGEVRTRYSPHFIDL